jgi:hypothetical protein
MLGLDEGSLGAFRARLRHLRSLGIPNVPKRGSGNAVAYKSQDIFITFVALALQTLGSAPTVSALIASVTVRYIPRLRSGEKEIFLVVSNIPDNIRDTPGYMPGVQSMSWINNQFGGKTFACVVAGAVETGKVVTHVQTIASSVINLSERFGALPRDA